MASLNYTTIASSLTPSSATTFTCEPTSAASEESTESYYYLYLASAKLSQIYLWVIFSLGFPGNTLAIITILRIKPSLRFTKYIALLGFVDNCCLLVKVTFLQLNLDGVYMGDFGCQSLQYLGTFTGQWANWILVMMTCERLVDIALPFFSRRITKRHYLVANCIIVVFLLGVNGTNFTIYYQTTNNGDHFVCSDVYNSSDVTHGVVVANGLLEMLLYSLLPVSLLTVMNIFIIRRLYQSVQTIERQLSVENRIIQKRRSFQKSATVQTVVTCAVFCVLVTPRPLFEIIVQSDRLILHPNVQIFLEQIFYLLSDLSHAVNFYVYFISNGFFRRRLLRLVKRPVERLFCHRRYVTNQSRELIISTWSSSSYRMTSGVT